MLFGKQREICKWQKKIKSLDFSSLFTVVQNNLVSSDFGNREGRKMYLLYLETALHINFFIFSPIFLIHIASLLEKKISGVRKIFFAFLSCQEQNVSYSKIKGVIIKKYKISNSDNKQMCKCLILCTVTCYSRN